MPRAHIVRETSIVETPRVQQMCGIFDVPPSKTSREEWTVNLPLEEKPWQIGLIVGPSGCGKTTVARELFGPDIVTGYDWPSDKSVLDGFPAGMGIKDITGHLSSVGFSSPPAWLRPFHVLSNGQQFRVTIARALAENRPLTVVDEFTSVVDRTVAQVGSHAIAKAIRRVPGQKFVAVACHYDIIDWLRPDWIFEPASSGFDWRSVQSRPAITLEIRRVHHDAWNLFKKHHYLTADLNRSAHCYCAFWGREPVVFYAVLPFPHPTRSGWRAHRMVCLPDYQGGGLSTAVTDTVAGVYTATGRPFFATTGNPALTHHHARSKSWRLISLDGADKQARSKRSGGSCKNGGRNTASFEYIGPPQPKEVARGFGLSLV